jgi:hypothetical protein
MKIQWLSLLLSLLLFSEAKAEVKLDSASHGSS